MTPVREAAPGRRQLGPGRLELAMAQLKWAILNPPSKASQANTPSAFICLTQGGGGEYREARMNLEMVAPPARGCVRAGAPPASFCELDLFPGPKFSQLEILFQVHPIQPIEI